MNTSVDFVAANPLSGYEKSLNWKVPGTGRFAACLSKQNEAWCHGAFSASDTIPAQGIGSFLPQRAKTCEQMLRGCLLRAGDSGNVNETVMSCEVTAPLGSESGAGSVESESGFAEQNSPQCGTTEERKVTERI